MARFFDQLLSNRGLQSAPIPLCKLNVTDEEYAELKNVIRQSLINNASSCYGKEYALFYAEVWRREYNGGKMSKDRVAEYAEINSSLSDVMYENARNALRSLNIPIIQQNNNQYFRTLLLQGGLPMAYVINEENEECVSRYELFLKSLLKETSRLMIDWDNPNCIENLSCVHHLRKTERNEFFYAVSLQIVHAINSNNRDLLPYSLESDEFESLTERLEMERKRVQALVITNPPTLQWKLKIAEGSQKVGIFLYSLTSLKTIYSSMIEGLNPQECFQFDLFVSQKYVATYKKVSSNQEENIATYKMVNSDNREFEWRCENVIDVKVITDNEQELFPSVIGSCPPNISIPQLFQKKNEYYVLQNGDTASECLVLYPPQWRIDDLRDLPEKEILVNGESFRYVELPEVRECDFLRFTNIETRDSIQLKNLTSKYSVIYGGLYLSWLKKSNYALLRNRPLVTVYNEDGDRLPNNQANMFYRSLGTRDWLPYTQRSNLVPGLNEIKVKLPDGSFDIRRFYFIGNMSFSIDEAKANEATIQCCSNWGRVYPVMQPNVEYKEKGVNRWSVRRRVESNRIPSTCSFEIKNGENPPLKISIPSPYVGLCLIKNDDDLVESKSMISYGELSDYKILCFGTNRQVIKFEYVGASNLGNHISISQNVKQGITSLSNYEEPISRIFNINGVGSFDRLASVRITIGEKSFFVRHFTLDTKNNQTSNAIEVSRINEDDSFVNTTDDLYACRLISSSEKGEPSYFLLEKRDCGNYAFPEDAEDGNYVVFSSTFARQRVVPRFYRLENHNICDDSVEERKSQKQRNIEEWKTALSNAEISTSNDWKNVALYIEIADKFRLPFKTFNAISVAVSTPELMTKLLLRLVMDGKIDSLMSALMKIEQECAMAFHWISPEILPQILGVVLENYPDERLLGMVRDSLHSLMIFTLDSDIAETMTRFLCGNLENKKIDTITNAEMNEYKSRAIGRNNDGNFNGDLPVAVLPLMHGYYNSNLPILPYQKTMIDSPLFVYEYTQGWNDGLWDPSPEGMQRRRIVNFYRIHYKYVYYDILVKMLK